MKIVKIYVLEELAGDKRGKVEHEKIRKELRRWWLKMACLSAMIYLNKITPAKRESRREMPVQTLSCLMAW